MGLAAGQARLLSITARKSDCEFQSMRLSHQKIALSRELSDLSNEYENSLDQTKLVYDYYGTGDTSNPLSYNLLMTPSALNEYMPITVTDSMGRVTLDSKYAAAARAAGIPQEGLGTLPSEETRNKFIQGLCDNGLITSTLSSTIQGLPYNQSAGFGGDITTSTTVVTGNINDLVSYLKENYTDQYHLSIDSSSGHDIKILSNGSSDISDSSDENKSADINIWDLLSTDDEDQYNIWFQSPDGKRMPTDAMKYVNDTMMSDFLDWIEDSLGSVLITDTASQQAFDKARSQIESILFGGFDQSMSADDFRTDYTTEAGHKRNSDWAREWAALYGSDYVGYMYVKNTQNRINKNNGAGSINLNNIAQAFLTLFVKGMDGWSKTNAAGEEKYYVTSGALSENRLVTNTDLKYSYTYTMKTGSSVSSDDLAQSTFYDTLFNQICANGWTENNNINDNEYLQEMLQSGMLYITKAKEDGYYYQGNYATDSYIKVVSDETAIAQAEAKYSSEKAKLNSKEEELDLKMKNLDTEISSLSTEYETVKNTISKNIEKSFKRYNA